MSLFTPGLVSITFRKLIPADVVTLVSKAGLFGIEWGGDVHVPHGDVKTAATVRRLTEAAGLSTTAYGSYYRVGGDDSPEFDAVLDTAVALGAPVIRVWAGNRDSADADEAYVDHVAADAHRIADLARAAGIIVAFEYHRGTIADKASATFALLARANHPALRTLWQPSVTETVTERLASLEAVSEILAHVHVFQWKATDRLPLSDGDAEWRNYLDILVKRGVPASLLIEFVAGDEPEAFLADARTLRNWIAQAEG
ncbi:MAG: TIM barrel protein [Capsulimonadaceae bacterium]|nr:TIM barrel protein [Capsulimonadaceae bacterium]